jgi:hypothetical protein
MTRFAAVAATVAAAAYAALVSQAVVTKYGLKILYAWHPLAASCFLVFAFLGVVTAQRASASGNRKVDLGLAMQTTICKLLFAMQLCCALLSSCGCLVKLNDYPSYARCPFLHEQAALDQHAYWQTAAALCALSTNAIIYVNKEQRGRPHLVSWHGKLGALTATLWLLTQVCCCLLELSL